ncbi:MAG: hypothetical protein HYS27_07895 [Deltaproteobacteria bacterium]|nr:hypothetical protein [Deltaproteobacteria bacterium]
MSWRAGCALALALVCWSGAGCNLWITSDFDGVAFLPDSTVLAVADRHDLLVRDGAALPVLKNRAGQELHLVLTGARLDPGADWLRFPVGNLLDLQRALATRDGLLLKGMSLDRFGDGETLKAVLDNGNVSGDFDIAVAPTLPDERAVAEQGLGSKITVTVVPKALDAQPRSGSLSADIEVKRERQAGQDGEVATGTVTIAVSTGLVSERVGEANLAVAEPILRCMAEVGPNAAGLCKDESPLPYVDSTGVVDF